jgi:hypothetical protein
MSSDPEFSRLAEQLELTQAELGKLVGVFGEPQVDPTLKTIASILAMATEMAGDEKRAVFWLKQQPIPAYGSKTAFDLFCEGRADAVLTYLEMVRLGAYA